MAEVEQFKAIASFQFIGEAEVRRMAQAMQEMGVLSEQAAARAINAAASMGTGMLSAVQAQQQFVSALGLSAATTNELNAQMQALARGQAPSQGLRDTVAMVNQLEASVRRLGQAGASMPAAIAERIRTEFATLFTQGAGMLASPPVKTRIDFSGATWQRQQLQTAAGTFVLSPNLGGKGYGLSLPGPTQQARAQAGEFDRVYRTRAEAISAVRQVLNAFGSELPRATRAQLAPPTQAVPDPTSARVAARLDRVLETQQQTRQAIAPPPADRFAGYGEGRTPRGKFERVDVGELRVGDVIWGKRPDATYGPLTVQAARQQGAHYLVSGTDPTGAANFARLPLQHSLAKVLERASGGELAWNRDWTPTATANQLGGILPQFMRVGDVFEGKVTRAGERVAARMELLSPLAKQGMFWTGMARAGGVNQAVSLAADRPVNVLTRGPEGPSAADLAAAEAQRARAMRLEAAATQQAANAKRQQITDEERTRREAAARFAIDWRGGAPIPPPRTPPPGVLGAQLGPDGVYRTVIPAGPGPAGYADARAVERQRDAVGAVREAGKALVPFGSALNDVTLSAQRAAENARRLSWNLGGPTAQPPIIPGWGGFPMSPKPWGPALFPGQTYATTRVPYLGMPIGPLAGAVPQVRVTTAPYTPLGPQMGPPTRASLNVGLPIPSQYSNAWARYYQNLGAFPGPGGGGPPIIVPPGGFGGGAGGPGGGGPVIVPPGGGRGGYPAGGGWRDDFMKGFRGRADRSYAEQLGQTFKFALFYGTAYKLLFGLTQTLQVSLDEAIKFQQGMTELSIATGRSADANKDLARNLGDAAAAVGLSPSEGLEIGARAIGLYDLGGASQEVQEAAMRRATTAVTQLQFTTGRKPEQLQLDVGAISQAFDFGYQAINRIADLDAYFTKRFGIKTGQSLETVAQTGSLGVQAGFSPEEIFAISAKLQSRTGQTPAAVAGLLSQIFSRAGEGALQGQFAQYGVDLRASYRDQFAQLSEVYGTLDPAARQRLSASFGRGRSQGAAAVLLEDFGEIASVAQASKTEAAGAAQTQFQARIDNVGGQLARLSGAFKNFGIELANTGLLDLFGAGVVALREFLETTTDVLRVWNEIPRLGRDLILAFGALALAARLGAGRSLGGALLARGGLAPASVVGTRAPILVNAAGQQVRTGGTGLINTTRALGARGTGAAAMSLFGGPVVVGAIATLTAIGIAKGTWDKLHAASQQATDAMLAVSSVDFTQAGDIRGAAASYGEAAKKRRDLPWASDLLSGLGAPFQRTANREAATFEANQEFLNKLADRQDKLAQERAANIARSTTPFGDLTTTSISQGFEQLQAAGVSAATRLRLFNEAITATGDAAREAAAAQFNLADFIGPLAGELIPDVAAGIKGEKVKYQTLVYDENLGSQVMGEATLSTGKLQDALKGVDMSGLQGELENAAREAGVTTGALDPSQITALADAARNYARDRMKLPADAVDAAADLVFREAYKFFEERTAEQRRALDPTRIYTETEQTGFLNTQVTENQKRLEEVIRGDSGGRVAALRKNVNELRAIQNRGAGHNEQLQVAINNALADYSEAQVERLKATQRQNVRNAPNEQAALSAARAGRQRLRNAAIQGRNPELLAELIEQGGAAEAELARAEIKRWYETEKAKLRTSKVVENIRNEMASKVMTAFGGGDNMSAAKQAAITAAQDNAVDEYLTEAEKALKAVMDALMGALTVGVSKGPSAAQIAAAQAGAALAPGDTVGEARVAMEQAAADMREAATEDPVKYANAQRAYNEAVAAYNAAQVDTSKIANSNRAAFIGGALANARSELQNAELELTKYTKGTQEYNQALGAYFQAQIAFADAARQARSEARTLNIDITDPVAEAREQARVSREALRWARRRARRADSPGGRSITEDEQAEINVRVNQARRDRTNAEGQAWQQQFSDMQTAEQLGRISHTAWIQYLQNESDRLHARKNKTRQQIEQMNQVDQALKAASEAMNAQFNLGDIKLPTPYQVRRAMGGGYDAARTQTVTQHITMNVNGNDLTAMMRALEDVLNGRLVHSTHNRKS